MDALPTFAAITLTGLDWSIVFGFFAVALGLGLIAARRAGQGEEEFFLGGRSMPWWLLGMSMVATTFSTDTPNFVTNIVRNDGVSSNWQWWSFLLTGMLTVFVYAKLWRRSGVTTDLEFYELRYSGREAALLRGFRAIYLGVFFNIVIMATVSLAAIKIGGIMLGLAPWECLVYAAAVTVIFSSLGGLRGVLLTDFVLFAMAMVGSFAAAYYALGHEAVGGLEGLRQRFEEQGLSDKLRMVPSPDDSSVFVGLFIVPLAIQWWSVWYPGAEPGGGGYLAQRMLAAKNERHAVAATLFFNVAHYALRPWPWILVALCSMLVFPDIASIQEAFPNAENVGEDSAYSAMLTFLPAGWMGLVLTSLVAAYMSTISTHLNWGSSYVVHDVYRRFLRPDASDAELVWTGRISTVVMMILAGALALGLEDAAKNFTLILQIGAGTGLLFILRWFWWRINAWSEITAMVVSFGVAIGFALLPKWSVGELNAPPAATELFGIEWWRIEESTIHVASHVQLISGVFITTLAWVAVTLVTRPTEAATLRRFVERTNPGGRGWSRVRRDAEAAGTPIRPVASPTRIGLGLLAMSLGCCAVYSTLFATGFFLYGQHTQAIATSAIALSAAVALAFTWFARGPSDAAST